MDHEEIAKKAAEAIMQRANDTYPRTLHKDMLLDEIGKAIREATRQYKAAWPPAIAVGDLPTFLRPPYNITVDMTGDPVTASHNESRRKLNKPLP